MNLVRAETGAGVVMTFASGAIGILTGAYFVTTLLPSIIGGFVHVLSKARDDRLAPLDLVQAGVVSLSTGFYGGPWIADMVPSSEKALPVMCFGAAYFATDIIDWVRKMIERHLGGEG